MLLIETRFLGESVRRIEKEEPVPQDRDARPDRQLDAPIESYAAKIENFGAR